MIDADFVWGVAGTLIYVVVVLLVLTYLGQLFPETAGFIKLIAIGLVIVAPGAGIALKIFEDL